jgi:hypothetical protein
LRRAADNGAVRRKSGRRLWIGYLKGFDKELAALGK